MMKISLIALCSMVPLVALSAEPKAPKNLNAEVDVHSVSLSWKDKSRNEDGFNVLRSVDNQEFFVIKKLPKNTEKYVDSGLESGKGYFYRVEAYNEAGYSVTTNLLLVVTKRPEKEPVLEPGLRIK